MLIDVVFVTKLGIMHKLARRQDAVEFAMEEIMMQETVQ